MLSDKKLFLFDIDGTVAIDETLIDGSRELFSHIDSIGGKSIFITNNSTKGVRDYMEKFRRMGVETDESNFITASYAAAIHLRAHYPGKKVFLLGTRSFAGELRAAGVDVTETLEPCIACAVVGFDSELTYRKVELLCELLLTRPVDYLATNPDLCCPVGFGAVPDCGAICKMIGCAVGREPLFIGKPNRVMVDLCLGAAGFSPDETLVVGDRLYTDIACGVNAGVDTAVVFTGEAKPEDIPASRWQPTWQFPDVRALLNALRE